MSSIIYNVAQVLKDKLLLADNNLMKFSEISKLMKQGMSFEFIHSETKENLSKTVIDKVRLFAFSEKLKTNEIIYKNALKQGLSEFIEDTEMQIISRALFEKDFDTTKAARALSVKPAYLGERLEKAGIALPKKKK